VYLKQRLRWAIDSVRLLVFDSPLLKPGLSLAQRIQCVHTTSFYLFAAMLNIFLLGPVAMGLLRPVRTQRNPVTAAG
jgi:cellulose synthase (UDP-forming)